MGLKEELIRKLMDALEIMDMLGDDKSPCYDETMETVISQYVDKLNVTEQ